jgi:hypothetical protein
VQYFPRGTVGDTVIPKDIWNAWGYQISYDILHGGTE